MRDLLAELARALELDRPCVQCVLVETRGSTPQKAGASMLVFPDGSQVGTLGGGCVEAEVKQRALRVLHTAGQEPELLTFSLDDNYGWDDGLICGGRMTILADPLTTPSRREAGAAAYVHALRTRVEEGTGCTEAVVVAESAGVPGTRCLFDHEGVLIHRIGGEPSGDPAAHLRPLSDRPGPVVRQGIAYLPVLPRITLLVVGGGHVGEAVARLAADVDFDVWVLDDRERYASRERFPRARNLLVGDIGATLQRLADSGSLNPSWYAVIVTRGHSHDEEALYHLARTPAGYVGMIGSKRKIRLIFEDLLARGLTEEQLTRVHAPLGFDIGSQTVPEIAISILAELIACRNLGGTIRAARTWVTVGTASS